MLDYFAPQLQDANAAAAQAPARQVSPDLGTSFSTAWEANERTSGMLAANRNQADYLQRSLDQYEAKTGERIVNPIAAGSVGPERDLMMRTARDRFSAKSTELNDPSLTFPSDDQIAQGGVQLARAAQGRAAQLGQGAQGVASYAGSVGAGLAAGAVDPVNAIALATIPEGGPVLMAALRAGATFGGSEAINQALGFGYSKQVDPNFGVGSALASVAEAGLGGFAMEGGVRGLGALWRRFSAVAPDAAAAMPLPVRDAGTTIERAADLTANNPFKTGATAPGVHAAAIAKVESDLLGGMRPEVPYSAVQEAGARTGTSFYPGGSVSVKYELAELGDLVTSHDADFRVNPDYPADLQPRDRGSAVARDQVQRIYSDLQPSRLGPSPEANAGAPIVGPDNVVESGNGRTLAIQEAYREGDQRASAYKAFLEQNGYDTSDFTNPVLVARRTTDMDPAERVSFAQGANGSASLRMSATEQALSDARHIDSSLVGLLKPGDVTDAANRDFVRGLVAKMPPGERGGMLTKAGGLSAGGVRRVQASLVARAFDDPEFVSRAFDHPDPNIKAIAGAMTDAAPSWIRLRDAVTRGEIDAGHDITPDVMTAVRAIMRARDEKRSVWEVLNQGDMFASDTAGLAARLFFRDGDRMAQAAGRGRVAEALSSYAEEAQKNTAAGRLFDDVVSPRDVLKTAARGAEERMPAGTAPLIRDALTPERVEKAFTDPAVQDAATQELHRVIELQGHDQVPIAEADGMGGASWKMGSAEAALREVDAQIDLAAEVRACAMPPVREAA